MLEKDVDYIYLLVLESDSFHTFFPFILQWKLNMIVMFNLNRLTCLLLLMIFFFFFLYYYLGKMKWSRQKFKAFTLKLIRSRFITVFYKKYGVTFFYKSVIGIVIFNVDFVHLFMDFLIDLLFFFLCLQGTLTLL